MYKFSSPRSVSGIVPTAHLVAEEAWFEAEGLRPHQTMAFCCKQRQGWLPWGPVFLCFSFTPHTSHSPCALCLSASRPLDSVQPASPYATGPSCLLDRSTLAFTFICMHKPSNLSNKEGDGGSQTASKRCSKPILEYYYSI